MEFFLKAKKVRLRSHYKKYLVAKPDEMSVGQDGDGDLNRAQWTVEFVKGSDSVIRLKSCYDKYLTASNGQKVLQTLTSHPDSAVEWEPIKHGSHIRLKSGGNSHGFLRGSGRLRLYSVTHHTADDNTEKSSLEWDVDILENLDIPKIPPGLEIFHTAKPVRLRSHYNKYLVAKDNKKSVRQDRDGSSRRAEWTVENVTDSSDSFIRLKSCYNKYLTPSSTGQKVLQTLPSPLDSTVEWKPIKDGEHYRLKSRNSTHSFLRGSGWRRWYSVTHYAADNETMKSSLKWDIEDATTLAAAPTSALRNVGILVVNATGAVVGVLGAVLSIMNVCNCT